MLVSAESQNQIYQTAQALQKDVIKLSDSLEKVLDIVNDLLENVHNSSNQASFS